MPVVLHSGLNYDNHLIVKELAEEFEERFKCLGKTRKRT